MSFRTRLLVASLVVAVVPLAIVGLSVRRVITARVTEQYRDRVGTLVEVLRRTLTEERRAAHVRVSAIAARLGEDNAFRQGLMHRSNSLERGYVLDFARDAMRAGGLHMLTIEDDRGRIVSSGHFRNEFDLLDPDLPRRLAERAGETVLVEARSAEAPFVALAALDSARIGGRWYSVVGGVLVDSTFVARLAAGSELAVRLVLPADTAGEPPADTVAVAEEIPLPYIATRVGGGGEVATARLEVLQSGTALAALRSALDRWFLGAAAASALLAVLLASWMASRVSRPLAELADQTARVDLDQLDVSFASDRPDEVGQLARLLNSMTQRLRTSVRTLKETERRAAVGDLARQINHDVKNGLTPIRNVLRHFTEVRDDAAELARVFGERRGTLESSVEYLERLAASYAGLYSQLRPERLDANEILRRVTGTVDRPPSMTLEVSLSAEPAMVVADRLALRRVVENLVGNAVDSLNGREGTVTVTSGVERRPRGPVVVLAIADTGKGMTREELDRAFTGFYTTKAQGAGLGLTIVRRLVTDMRGSLRVDTEPGAGTHCTIELAYGGSA